LTCGPFPVSLPDVIELRVLAPDDWKIWRGLRLAALAEAPQAFGSRLADWQGDGDRERRWRDRLQIPGSHNLVACLDGQPVAMASGVPTERDGVAEVISMWVGPDARGKGVGDLLLREIEGWALRRGATALRLSVMPGNDPALALYRRNGFQATGEPGDLLPDGVGREEVMAKPLRLDRTQTVPGIGAGSGGPGPDGGN
jgi:ribosomal protein S18 acetylase RimI-like enzyme